MNFIEANEANKKAIIHQTQLFYFTLSELLVLCPSKTRSISYNENKIEINDFNFNTSVLKLLFSKINFDDHLITFFPWDNGKGVKIVIRIISERFFCVTKNELGEYIPGM